MGWVHNDDRDLFKHGEPFVAWPRRAWGRKGKGRKRKRQSSTRHDEQVAEAKRHMGRAVFEPEMGCDSLGPPTMTCYSCLSQCRPPPFFSRSPVGSGLASFFAFHGCSRANLLYGHTPCFVPPCPSISLCLLLLFFGAAALGPHLFHPFHPPSSSRIRHLPLALTATRKIERTAHHGLRLTCNMESPCYWTVCWTRRQAPRPTRPTTSPTTVTTNQSQHKALRRTPFHGGRSRIPYREPFNPV